MSDEALACFASLRENVPAWIADLDTILNTAVEKQEETLLANQPPASIPVSLKRKATSKGSSLRSRLSRRDGLEDGGSRTVSHPQMKHLTHSDALRLSQRKRKTASVCSGMPSVPRNFRTKAAAVVYYDGDTQRKFETLVRTIGSSRNSIRRAKMSTRVQGHNRSATDVNGEETNSSSSGSSGDEAKASSVQLNYKSSRYLWVSQNTTTMAFDKVDGGLEKAQTLCERAAHQVLRDGDCVLEVSNAKERFAEVIKLIEAELPRVRGQAIVVAEQRRRSEERRRYEAAAEEKRKPAAEMNPTFINVMATPFPPDGQLGVDDIEVDDDSDDDGYELNVSAVRGNYGGRCNFAHVTGSRLTAH